MGLTAKKAEQRFTYSDYLAWPENERWELIDGIAYNMNAAPSRFHQDICVELVTQIRTFLRGKPCRVYSAPFDVRFPEKDKDDKEIKNVVQPDIAVICNQAKMDDKGCYGAPDWIIEILSPFTSVKDMNEKFYLYEKQSVKEYWIIDPSNKVVTVYRLNTDNKFERSGVFGPTDNIQSTVLVDLTINLSLAFE